MRAPVRSRLLLCASLLILTSLCWADVPHKRSSGPPAVSSSPSGAPPVRAPRDALLGAVDEITRQVAALRGLPLKTPFKRGVLSREEIGQKLRERINKEYTSEEVRTESGVLKRMGLLPEGADYEKLLFDLLTEQVAGFYDPYTKTLYIADWLPLEMQRPAMAHEIEHALQDQYFDLRRFSQPLKEDGDRQLARAAVVEGDGTAVMLEFVAQSMGLDLGKMPEMVSRLGKQMMQMSMGTTPAFHDAPPVLRETLVFPYAAGLDFVESIRTAHPWTQVDEVFRHPPDSTEQILHPEKYHNHEMPVPITPVPLPALLGRAELRRDVLGEMVFKVWFSAKLPEGVAERAAAGWGGDRMVAYAPGPPEEGEAPREDTLPLVVVLSTWDTDNDAREAERAARQLFSSLSAAKEAPDRAPPSYFAERRGRLLLMLCGVPQAIRAKVADEAFRLWKVDKAR